jgi:hypothetical protein
MKRLLSAIALIVAAFPALADPPALAVIHSITPGFGTVSGGDTVTIVVSPPLVSCICSPPAYFAEVTFDGVPARSVYAWQDTIYAVTPAHAAGAVTVAVSAGVSYGTTTFNYHGWGSGLLVPDNYEKVLIPIALPQGSTVPGSFGSQWTSAMWAVNPTNYPVEFFSDISCTLICPVVPPGERAYPHLPENSLLAITPNLATGNYGFLYYLQKTYAKDVTFSLHVADTSRGAENAGTEIGVVRASEFRGASFDILDVPIDSGSRATLRIYDPNAADSYQEATVFVYSMADNALLATAAVPLHVPAKKDTQLGRNFPPYAGFAQIGDLHGTFPSVPLPSRVRLRVEFHTGVNQSWGFVSVTNNATQLITIYRPE